MYTIYASTGTTIKTIATVEFFASAAEIVEREMKFGCAEQIWIEGPNGEIYN